MKLTNKGKGKGKGKSFGGGGGSWVFMPAAPTYGGYGHRGGGWGGAPQIVVIDAGMGMQGFGKGGKGKGGKGKGGKDERHMKNMDKLGKIEADRKVWVGGLSKDMTFGKLEKHFKELDCKPSVTEIMGRGSACLAFKTADEAANAIAVVNGSELVGQTIEVDVWTQKEKKERTPGDKPKKAVVKTGLKPKSGEQLKKDAKMEEKVLKKLEAVDADLKVKVSGLPLKADWKKLKGHFTENGCEISGLACITKPGTALATFKTADEVTAAVAAITGTKLDGKTLTVEAEL